MLDGSSSARPLVITGSQRHASIAASQTSALGAPWTSVGPNQVMTPAYGNVTGRVTAITIDPADLTGNTVYVGTTGGGVWKSTNAAGPAASVSFVPLTDTLPVFSSNAGSSGSPSLSIGSMAMANGVLLAGTGDPNDATDSYYGGGLLRSIDAGTTWTLIRKTPIGLAGSFGFTGLSFAGIAFSSATPSLVVAAVSQAVTGVLVNAPLSNSVMGLYYSQDAGVTWQYATVLDGGQTVQSPNVLPPSQSDAATAVVWNPVRQRFYAAIRFHGYYESADGVTWTRLAAQPGTGLSTAACPPNAGGQGSQACPIFRGALAVQPVSGDMFALTTDVNNLDQGLWQDVCALAGSACGNPTVHFGTRLGTAALEVGSGSTRIVQGDYNLALAAVPVGTDTVVYAGTVDLYRCSLAGGCVFRNTTNALNGCATPARVAPAQHAIATLPGSGQPLLYLGNDGGIWRSSDGVDETGAPCVADDANHFQNLNGGLGSLAEIVSFAQHPTDPATLLAGMGANGTAGTGAAGTGAWNQLAAGEGGTVAIDPANPSLWYLSTAAGVNVARCANGATCNAADFSGTASVGAAQVANDVSATNAAWMLDPVLTSNLVVGTCRTWRGPATGGPQWTSANVLSRPFGAAAATACSAGFPVVRSLSAGGLAGSATAAQNAGSPVLYAGLAGALDGGGTLGGHLFTTKAAGTASNTTVWTDAALSPVGNDTANAGVFNPGGFNLSSVVADPHDVTGATVYATVMGFSGNGIGSPHLYRSDDFGSHWTNLSSNLPDAPANSVLVDPNDANTVYIAMDSGVYVTSQISNCPSTNCWSVFGTALPNSPVVQLAAAVGMATGDGRTGELRAATYGRGIWQIPLLTAAGPGGPMLLLNPMSLTFAAQQVGTQSGAQSVTVQNTGNSPMIVSRIVATNEFTEAGDCIGTPIAIGSTCTIQVRFLPESQGAQTGQLTVYANVSGGQATVMLSGNGSPPSTIVLTPVSLAFSAVVGATSPVQNITISNTGSALASLQMPSISGDFRISANSCGSSLASQTGCTVSIVFAPGTSGAKAGTFTIMDDAGTQTASLTGTASSPATDALSPLALTFAAQQEGTASASEQVTITNSGDLALTLIAAQITSGDFAVVNGCGNSLNGHSACSLRVTFTPRNVGASSGIMTVSDQFRSQQVTLAGFGLAPPGVSLSPQGSVAFGPTAVGGRSAPQTVTLTNNGGVLLTIQSLGVSGDFAVLPGQNACGSSLAIGSACTLDVVFAPSAPGPRRGAVTLLSSAPVSPQTLSLGGAGVDFALTPNGATTVTVPSGTSAVFPLLLSSAVGVPGTVAFTCTGNPAHTSCLVTPATQALGSTSTISVTIATGVATASLSGSRPGWMHSSLWFTGLVPLGLLALRRRRWGKVLPGAVLLAMLGLAGCGSGRLVPGDGVPTAPVVTPPGTSGVVVTASSAGLSRSVNLTLIVR